MIKRLICIFLAACLLCGTVFAAEPGSVTVKLFYGGAPVSGGSVTLYDDTGVAVATGDVSGDGTVVFTDLPAGRYLVVQEAPAEGFAPFEPFTVEVADNDVEASPKMKPGTEEEPPEPETPPTPPQSDTDLPYTGQITWPIPVLAAAGLALIMFGVYLWTRGKRHEA